MELNQIFRENQYNEACNYCFEHNYTIKEIEADESGRRFQIIELSPPTEEELIQQEIIELKQRLAETDYQAIKFAEGILTIEEYAEMKAQRQAWRERINELEKQL